MLSRKIQDYETKIANSSIRNLVKSQYGSLMQRKIQPVEKEFDGKKVQRFQYVLQDPIIQTMKNTGL
jgi:hypothetical protein